MFKKESEKAFPLPPSTSCFLGNYFPGRKRRSNIDWPYTRHIFQPFLLVDHIYRTVRERGHVQVTVGTTDDVGDDAKILAGDKALALSLIELVVVVIDFVFQFGITERELPSAIVESEFGTSSRHRGTYERRRRRDYPHVASRARVPRNRSLPERRPTSS